MKAHEIMTRDVVTVVPATPVLDVAKLMSERHISGVPVLSDDGHLLGIVSGSDLLHRRELGTERKTRAWLGFFADPDAVAREYAKSHGLKAHDVMSRPVVSVGKDADLQQVADVLDAHRIQRVTVVDKGKLVGVISRGDLVRALSTLQVRKTEGTLDDRSIHKALSVNVRKLPWLDTSYVSLTVTDGHVEAWGFASSASQRDALRVLIEETEGVKSFVDNTKLGAPRFMGV